MLHAGTQRAAGSRDDGKARLRRDSCSRKRGDETDRHVEPPVTVTPDIGLEECCRLMEQNQIRRLPVVDQTGRCCGVISQADVAKATPTRQTAEVVSERSEHASRVAA